MTRWSKAIEKFALLHPHRHQQLFSDFLPRGYDLMTLSSVDESERIAAIEAKCFLGMYITLCDDLADNPSTFNPALLDELYDVPFRSRLSHVRWSEHENEIIAFTHLITGELLETIGKLPRYNDYRKLFQFDVEQFHNANRYYTLAHLYPHLGNSVEARHFGPFNMGMIIAGTIDIMASPQFRDEDLGQARAIFLFAQRYGHICNSITTLKREVREETFTNEAILLSREKSPNHDLEAALSHVDVGLSILRHEQEILLDKLVVHARLMKSFDANRYMSRLRELHKLHEHFMGII